MANKCTYFLLITLSVLAVREAQSLADWSVPAIFILGDSAVDVGTNNYVNGTHAVASFPYYGIDYPGGKPTGRFSNGYNVADQIAMLFEFPGSPPSYLPLVQDMSTFKYKILQGVNFASAGAGIQDTTGQILWSKVVNMTEQILQFSTIRGNISLVNGTKVADKFISESLYIFCLGANDILDYKRSNNTMLKDDFMSILESGFRKQLQDMYNLGARKFGVMGIPPIGCWPYTRAMNKSGGCLSKINEFAQALQVTYENLLQKISLELPEMKYSFGDIYGMTEVAFKHSLQLGFKEMKSACCGNGTFNAEVYCYQLYNPRLCSNRSEYFFWDLYHPTEYATSLTAATLFMGDTQFMRPRSFSQLAEMK